MKSYKSHIKETIKLALPVSIGQLGHIMMGVVDSLMVGRLGHEPLAAASLVNGLFFLILVLGFGMTIAITPLVSIAKGAKKKSECGIVLQQGLIVTIVSAFILVGIVLTASLYLDLLNQPPKVTELAVTYFQLLGLSIIPFMLFQNYRQFIEGLSDVNPPMIIAITANIFNFFFNWLLIFGNLGMPALGLDGAGWATFGTRALMAIALIIYFYKKDSYKEYRRNKSEAFFDKKIIRKIVSIGLPTGSQMFLEIAAFSFASIMIGWIGSVPLAAHQIAINIASVTYMTVLGIAAAGTIRVGTAVGEGNITETRKAGFTSILLSFSLMLVFGILMIFFNKILPHLYIENREVIDIASKLIIVAAFFQVFDGTQAAGLGVLRGLKDVKIPMVLAFSAYWIVAIPTSFILGFTFEMGVVGIWIGLAAGLASIAVLLVFRFNRVSKNIIHF
ncbi:MAG: MATE family efflux transporter [Melioribacteraceae bacterium]|nr:MATE family efflux transporter [Melioribacteraceae bacterium]MCF8354905.1 MATE family efflux transporter [Melioribacteraceae bacterium]MCF8396038.1 MATE family efflux transporter [Melioribacteraceae bacterium]MCF8421059.1 MATE family efflux transporter [Melioribacteraceae bacterium]